MKVIVVFLLLATAASAGCSSSSDDTTNPTVTGHLYVGDDNATGSLRVYNLPLTSGSAPVASIPLDKAFLLDVNATQLAVSLLNDSIDVFTLPLTSASHPFATFNGPSNVTPVFLANGSIETSGSGVMDIFAPPFTNGTVASDSILIAGHSFATLTRSADGTVYGGSGGNAISQITSAGIGTTVNAPSGTLFRGLAVSGNQLFACSFTSTANSVLIYALPLTAAATPTVTIPIPGGYAPEGCAADASGNLYVGIEDGHISVFAPPFSNSSAPTLTISSGAVLFGMVAGQ